MARPIIKSFDSVNRLYRKGVNICKGCERENNGSCTIVHLGICDEQAARHIPAIKRVTTYNVYPPHGTTERR